MKKLITQQKVRNETAEKKIYHNAPTEIQNILQLFNSAALQYLLFKCEHILQGKNKNVDILFRTDQDFRKASMLLEQQKYILYLEENDEKYKRMYLSFDGNTLTAIHLHQQVAWHGLIALEKDSLFQRTNTLLPSPEDALLIHTAHALFENFKVNDFQKNLLREYKTNAKDEEYILQQLQNNGWKRAYEEFSTNFNPKKSTVMKAYLGHLRKKPHTFLSLGAKVITAARRKISLKRRGYLIALIGMNGSGKSTMKEALLERYKPLTNFIAGQYGYYFGWKQSSFSKVLSKIFSPLKAKKGEKLFDSVSTETIKSFDLFQELLFMYIYFRSLAQYYFSIYPKLRKNRFVVTDRYFYDIYGQYPYSQNSKIMKFLIFPKPDKTVFLDVDVNRALERDKAGQLRIPQPREKLEGQKKRYSTIAQKINATTVDANKNFWENVDAIINTTWREYVEKKNE